MKNHTSNIKKLPQRFETESWFSIFSVSITGADGKSLSIWDTDSIHFGVRYVLRPKSDCKDFGNLRSDFPGFLASILNS